jgi:membrane-associated protease RseP (regulator of RpoE activity)
MLSALLLAWGLWITTALLYLLLGIGAFRLTERLLCCRDGFEPTPLFDTADRPMTRAACWLPRVAAVVVPWLVFFGLLVAVTAGRGLEVPSNRVEVLAGPAKQAGMQSGDRVLAVDGQPTTDFEAVRRAITASGESHRFLVERAGTRRDFDVVPDGQGRVSIRATYDRQPVQFRQATVAAWRQAVLVPRAAIGTLNGQRHELVGPVGIVRAVAGAPGTRIYDWLSLDLAVVGGYGALVPIGLLFIETWSHFFYRRRITTWLAGHPHHEDCELHWVRLCSSLVWLGPLWLGFHVLDAALLLGDGPLGGLAILAKVVQFDWAFVMFFVASRVLRSRWRWLWGMIGAVGLLNLFIAAWLLVSARKLCRRPASAS